MTALLSKSFLQHGAPELVPIFRVHVDEFVSLNGKSIVDENLDPSSILPELKAEYSYNISQWKLLDKASKTSSNHPNMETIPSTYFQF